VKEQCHAVVCSGIRGELHDSSRESAPSTAPLIKGSSLPAFLSRHLGALLTNGKGMGR
jgi:hypothetical protein